MSAAAAPENSAKRNAWRRLLGVAIAILGLVGIGVLSGVHELDQEQVRSYVLSFGAWGVGMYVLMFCLGQIMQVPGAVFVAAAVYAWGGWAGGSLALLGAVVAINVNFTLLKTLGGGALMELDKPFLTRLLGRLHERPLLVIIVTRFLMMTSPVLTTTLALAGIGYRKHFIGSVIGMAPMVAIWAFGVHLAL